MLHLVTLCQLVSFLHLPNTKLAHYLLGAWVKVLVLNWLIYQGCHTFHKISLFDLKEILSNLKLNEGANNNPAEFVLEKAFVG